MSKAPVSLATVAILGLLGGGYLVYDRDLKARARVDELERAMKADQLRQAELAAQQQTALRAAEIRHTVDELKMERQWLRVSAERAQERAMKAFQAMESAPSQETVAAAMKELEATEALVSEAKSLVERAIAVKASSDYALVQSDSRLPDDLDAKKSLDLQRTIDALRTVRTGHRHEMLDVRADDGWQGTTMMVRAKETVLLRATGQWQVGNRGTEPWITGPQGEDVMPEGRIEPAVWVGAVIAKVEGAAQVFPGWGGFAAPRDGKLQFRINDRNTANNSGSLHLEIWVLPHVDMEGL